MGMQRRVFVVVTGASCAILACSGLASAQPVADSRRVQPPPVQEPFVVQGLPLDGFVRRDQAPQLPKVRPIALPEDRSLQSASRLLGDGTLYRLDLDKTATLVRFEDLAAAKPASTRIPLVAPPGVQLRSEYGSLRVASGTAGLLMDRHRRGSAWWKEDGTGGRHIEFRIDGDRAELVPPAAGPDDSDAPVAHRFDATPDRELSYRLSTGAVVVGPNVPRARLGGGGFSLTVARIGREETEAFLQLPAFDLPHVDAGEPAPGVLTLTIGYQTGSGHVGQVTYDSQARAWRDYRPLLEFPDAQTVEVADVGAAGVLAVLGLPWNVAEDDPETGLYWIRPGQPVRHLLQRIRELRAVALPDGYVALFADESTRDKASKNRSALFVLRAQHDRLALHRLRVDGPCSPSHFVWLGENRFLATFCSDQAVAFEVPELPPK